MFVNRLISIIKLAHAPVLQGVHKLWIDAARMRLESMIWLVAHRFDIACIASLLIVFILPAIVVGLFCGVFLGLLSGVIAEGLFLYLILR